MSLIHDAKGLHWNESREEREEGTMDTADCMKAQKDCRDHVEGMLGRKVSWRYAAILIAFVSAIVSACFAFSVAAQVKAGDIGQSVAVQAAAQAKENEFLRRDIVELKDQNREILAIVRTLDREKK